MTTPKPERREPKTAQCWYCHRKYDKIDKQNGGVLGHCHKCDGLQWIIAPSLNRKVE